MEKLVNDTKMDYACVKEAALILRAINHKLRIKILALIEEKKRIMVTDIYVKLRMEQSVASQHLAILRHANVVTTERDGKAIYYSLNQARISDIQTFVTNTSGIANNRE